MIYAFEYELTWIFGVFHAEANIEVCLGGVALRAIGADCGGRGARVSRFTGLRNEGGGHAKRPRSR